MGSVLEISANAEKGIYMRSLVVVSKAGTLMNGKLYLWTRI
jgi:hypothetical protein